MILSMVLAEEWDLKLLVAWCLDLLRQLLFQVARQRKYLMDTNLSPMVLPMRL